MYVLQAGNLNKTDHLVLSRTWDDLQLGFKICEVWFISDLPLFLEHRLSGFSSLNLGYFQGPSPWQDFPSYFCLPSTMKLPKTLYSSWLPGLCKSLKGYSVTECHFHCNIFPFSWDLSPSKPAYFGFSTMLSIGYFLCFFQLLCCSPFKVCSDKWDFTTVQEII